jgi:UDP-galactopyranose mutase
MKEKYDYLIVGSGLYGAVCARELTDKGLKVLVIDKRSHLGGNVYNEKVNGINVHKYGAHIFHTSDDKIWSYVNKYAEFNNYINSPVAINGDKIMSLPFNMWTFSQIWNEADPNKVKAIIDKQRKSISKPSNLEEQAISLVGTDVYELLIKGYTEKQWGVPCTELPASIIKRLPVRFTYNNNYFNDKYQGIPIGGYNKIIDGLLEGIETQVNVDFFETQSYFKSLSKKIIFTGKIDEFYDYKFGKLDYRSLKFEHEELQKENFQGNAVVNYTNKSIPYTRILEHKHFEFTKSKNTIITKEYSEVYNGKNEAYYPINNLKNNDLYNLYKNLSLSDQDVYFGGRLGEYKYYDMHQVIGSALSRIDKYVNNLNNE